MWATKFDMDLFAKYLVGEMGFPVIDQTGLSGVYDFQLSWNPDDGKQALSRIHVLLWSRRSGSNWGWNSNGVEGWFEVVVVDSAEKASVN